MTINEHILTCLIEEAAEVQKNATKILRFGKAGKNIYSGRSNIKELDIELTDLIAVVEVCQDFGIPIGTFRAAEKKAKKVKFWRCIKYSQAQGLIDCSIEDIAAAKRAAARPVFTKKAIAAKKAEAKQAAAKRDDTAAVNTVITKKAAAGAAKKKKKKKNVVKVRERAGASEGPSPSPGGSAARIDPRHAPKGLKAAWRNWASSIWESDTKNEKGAEHDEDNSKTT